MDAVIINVVIGEDRHLDVDLPQDLPVGPVELIIRPLATAGGVERGSGLTLESARAKLAAAGALSTAFVAPPGAVELTTAERRRLGRLFAGPQDLGTLIDEDRGQY